MAVHLDVPLDAPRDLIGAGSSHDPAVGLGAVVALRRLTEQLEGLQVQSARDQGWSWSAIAAAIGVSKQAVHRKHARRVSSCHSDGSP